MFCIWDGKFDIWDGVFDIWNGKFGIWDSVFGIWDGEFGKVYFVVFDSLVALELDKLTSWQTGAENNKQMWCVWYLVFGICEICLLFGIWYLWDKFGICGVFVFAIWHFVFGICVCYLSSYITCSIVVGQIDKLTNCFGEQQTKTTWDVGSIADLVLVW